MRIRSQHVAVAKMIEAVKHGPATYSDIREECGMNCNTLMEYMSVFHRAGLVYISGWYAGPHGGRVQKMWGWRTGANQRDVPKPPPKTRATTSREHRERKAKERLHSALTLAA